MLNLIEEINVDLIRCKKVIDENNYLETVIAIEELQDKYRDKIKSLDEKSKDIVWNYSMKDLVNIKDSLIEYREEIISEVFFILWKNRNKLNIHKYLSSYIAGITRNVVKEYLRKVKFNYDISDYENSLYSYDKIDLLNNGVEEISKIEKKLENMKEIDKKVFLDFYYSSKSIKDIAKEQKISEFSVKQRLYRIRNKIKKEVQLYE